MGQYRSNALGRWIGGFRHLDWRPAGQLTPRAPLAANRACNAALDLLYPRTCGYCRAAIDCPGEGVLLCQSCRANMVSRRAACAACGAALEAMHTGQSCPRCRDRRLRFASTVRLGLYDGLLRSAVLRMKRAEELPLGVAVGRLLAEERHEQLGKLELDVVVPVPMHWRRRAWRGINCPEVLARQIADEMGLPVAGHLLRRRRATRPQSELAPTARVENVRGAFVARLHRDLPGARVLLVDDIMTTGSTCSEAAKVLRRAGAAFVAVAVAARAEGA